jgi:hypothetical protein
MISTAERSRPSTTVIAGAIILALAIVATAVAGSEGLNSKLTKASVKKVAKRQINKAAPGLSVAAADSAYARALVRTDPLEVSLARNLTQAQVDQPRVGVTCFDLDFIPVGVQVTKESDGQTDAAAVSAVIDPLSRVPQRRGGPFNGCEPGTDVQVTARSPANDYVNVGFFIELSR